MGCSAFAVFISALNRYRCIPQQLPESSKLLQERSKIGLVRDFSFSPSRDSIKLRRRTKYGLLHCLAREFLGIHCESIHLPATLVVMVAQIDSLVKATLINLIG
jgi:hypothetical protein